MTEITSENSALRAMDQPADDDYTSLHQRIIVVVQQAVYGKDGSKEIADVAETTIPKLTDWVLERVKGTELFSVLCKEDAGGNTLLHEAARMGYRNVFGKIEPHLKNKELKKLLKMKNHGGVTSLLVAINSRQIETANWILGLDLSIAKDIVAIEGAYGITALSAAAATGSVNLVKSVIKAIGRKVYNQLLLADKSGNTAMHIAASFSYHEVALYLLENSNMSAIEVSNILGLKNMNGLTPLAYARNKGQNKFASQVEEYLRIKGIALFGKVNKLLCLKQLYQ